MPEAPATLANWQQPPHNRWALRHFHQVVRSAPVRPGAPGSVSPLRRADPPVDLMGLPLRRAGGSPGTVGGVLGHSYTDAVVILHGGSAVHERYAEADGVGPGMPHALMSVTKGVVGAVAGILAGRGLLNPSEPVTTHIPELKESAYRDATIRDVLDMRSGVAISDGYVLSGEEVRRAGVAMGWRPPGPADGDDPSLAGIYSYAGSRPGEGAHGEAFSYRSCETDVLGWACERVGGAPMAELISSLLWTHVGQDDAWITCDPAGVANYGGGFCASARDLARFGQVLLDSYPAERAPIVPAAWVRDGWEADAGVRAAFARSPHAPFLPGGWFRNQWWFVPRPPGTVLALFGIYGQMLYVSPATGTVAVKLSSWPQPNAAMMQEDTLRAFDAVSAALAEGSGQVTG